ncbi:MAG: hypothetical protein M0C28_46475 [Candidatus Moduliflexus flocculans]|nr:hypothetical protein [Candidatus Moduliflexus flocculans]
MPADVPLIRERTLKALLRPHVARSQSLTFLGVGGQSGISDILAVRSSDAFPLLRGISPVRRHGRLRGPGPAAGRRRGRGSASTNARDA